MVMAVARQLRLNPLPFAMTTVWLANTASPLLPVSNLTNLRALYRFSALGLDHSGYISLALSPALAAIVATVVVLAVIHLRVLRGHSRGSPNTPRRDVADCGRLRVPDARAPPLSVSSPRPSRHQLRPWCWSAPPWCATFLFCATSRCADSSLSGSAGCSFVVDIALGHGLRDLLASWAGTRYGDNRPVTRQCSWGRLRQRGGQSAGLSDPGVRYRQTTHVG